MILTIYDIDYNGKTGKKKDNNYTFIHDKYPKCILNFKENLRVCYLNIKINNNLLYENNKSIDLQNISKIIFNYGEDQNYAVDYIKIAKNIYDLISNNYNHITMYNNPYNHDIISDNFITYTKLKKCKYINIPDFDLIKNENDIKKINKYPIILSQRQQTGGKGKNKITSIKDFNNIDYKNKYWSKFYDSLLPNTKYIIGIRLFVFNNKLVDFSCRPSLEWNVHNGNQIKNIDILKKADDFFINYIKNNKDFINMLDELHHILGNGLYGHDFILHNNKLILCELGYKTLDQSLMKFHKDNNLLNVFSQKICNNPSKVHNTYKKLLLN